MGRAAPPRQRLAATPREPISAREPKSHPCSGPTRRPHRSIKGGGTHCAPHSRVDASEQGPAWGCAHPIRVRGVPDRHCLPRAVLPVASQPVGTRKRPWQTKRRRPVPAAAQGVRGGLRAHVFRRQLVERRGRLPGGTAGWLAGRGHRQDRRAGSPPPPAARLPSAPPPACCALPGATPRCQGGGLPRMTAVPRLLAQSWRGRRHRLKGPLKWPLKGPLKWPPLRPDAAPGQRRQRRPRRAHHRRGPPRQRPAPARFPEDDRLKHAFELLSACSAAVVARFLDSIRRGWGRSRRPALRRVCLAESCRLPLLPAASA